MTGSQQELRVEVDGAVLAGSLWMPNVEARASLLMIPGSGPATRTCGGYFAPIIDHLLQQGLAIAAFDKRGAGESTGSFAATEIPIQASDAHSCLDVLQAETNGIAGGVFGHSQGGWVAFELASQRPELAFVISNSGPAVSPAAQERSLLLANPDHDCGLAEAAAYDQAVAAARRRDPQQDVMDRLLHIDSLRQRLSDLPPGEHVEWDLEISFMRYEPLQALQALTMPTLVVHGEYDEMIPVAASLEELAGLANPAIETVLLGNANHRLLDAGGQDLVDDYLPTLTRFIETVLGRP